MGRSDSRAAREGSTVPKENPAKKRGRVSGCPPVKRSWRRGTELDFMPAFTVRPARGPGPHPQTSASAPPAASVRTRAGTGLRDDGMEVKSPRKQL